MALDTDTVRRIARLARIHIPEEDLEPLAGELSNIIGWVEQLAEVDTEGVEPMTSVVDTTPTLRDDVVTDGGYPDQVLANAPAATDGFFTVPKVVE
jgi:aspartyl-tRNA(Asn)/glutamyl-tRNA(Gln) amidotransferase subunit C